MLRRLSMVLVVGVLGSSSPDLVFAQETPPLWIRSVTIDTGATTATITGTGFNETCGVTQDGQALTVLPGGVPSRLVAVVPTLLLATPGTYRLTVTDPI